MSVSALYSRSWDCAVRLKVYFESDNDVQTVVYQYTAYNARSPFPDYSDFIVSHNGFRRNIYNDLNELLAPSGVQETYYIKKIELNYINNLFLTSFPTLDLNQGTATVNIELDYIKFIHAKS